MVLDASVEVSRTIHAGKGYDTVDEEDAAEVDNLLEAVGAVSIEGGSDSDGDVTVTEDVDVHEKPTHGVQQGSQSSGKNQARCLPGVHPEYNAIAPGGGSNE
ncbi:hypothetical protein TNCV_4360021 [Trichonephila clavipes]|uniref:Uncharacterized protein n=1 Tax=Trichonephila clavipes TaxID=2585209 RepID=A0A8X7BH46_TRICX|nr:hypothetical protein TNCV_4360021 [Trichonephila clavipes]